MRPALIELDCDYGQGFLYGHPYPADAGMAAAGTGGEGNGGLTAAGP